MWVFFNTIRSAAVSVLNRITCSSPNRNTCFHLVVSPLRPSHQKSCLPNHIYDQSIVFLHFAPPFAPRFGILGILLKSVKATYVYDTYSYTHTLTLTYIHKQIYIVLARRSESYPLNLSINWLSVALLTNPLSTHPAHEDWPWNRLRAIVCSLFNRRRVVCLVVVLYTNSAAKVFYPSRAWCESWAPHSRFVALYCCCGCYNTFIVPKHIFNACVMVSCKSWELPQRFYDDKCSAVAGNAPCVCLTYLLRLFVVRTCDHCWSFVDSAQATPRTLLFEGVFVITGAVFSPSVDCKPKTA